MNDPSLEVCLAVPTKIQQKYIDTIREFNSENGFSPNHKELSQILGRAGNAVTEMLERLESMGFILTVRDRTNHIRKTNVMVPDGED